MHCVSKNHLGRKLVLKFALPTMTPYNQRNIIVKCTNVTKLSSTDSMTQVKKHYNYTGCTQCATPKLPKKVLHIGNIVAHWGHCPEKIETKFLIENRPFLPILKKGSIYGE